MDDSADTVDGAPADLAGYDCATVSTLVEAARLIDAAADDLEWTVIDPVDLPGMRRAARLLTLHAAAHDRSRHHPFRDVEQVGSDAYGRYGDLPQ